MSSKIHGYSYIKIQWVKQVCQWFMIPVQSYHAGVSGRDWFKYQGLPPNDPKSFIIETTMKILGTL